MKKCLVLGSSGLIGVHLVKHLQRLGHYVIGADQNWYPDGWKPDHATKGDLRKYDYVKSLFEHKPDEVYHLAADMGGAEYIFTGDNDTDIMMNSMAITMNVIKACKEVHGARVFYSSSACIYPVHNQMNSRDVICTEDSAYPANPDSNYGWEKLMAERLFMAAGKNHGLSVRIARIHNVFGPMGPWTGGREKAPAAICRKIAQAPDRGTIDIFGTGEQRRSFLPVSECTEGILRIMASDYTEPLNLGSEEMISINELVGRVADIAGKQIYINHVPGPLGVNARVSDNTLIREKLNWAPAEELNKGLSELYNWVELQVKEQT